MIVSIVFQILRITTRFIYLTQRVGLLDQLHLSPCVIDFYLVVDLALNRIPSDLRPSVVEIISQPKSSPSQKRALLLKKGLLRSTADELEVLAEVGKTNIPVHLINLESHV